MVAMSWAKGAVTARLLTLRTASSTLKAAPTRHTGGLPGGGAQQQGHGQLRASALLAAEQHSKRSSRRRQQQQQ
jgi:hypothetical protein